MNSHSDELIDRVLTGMRETEVPTGLEARIAARLAQVNQANETIGRRFVSFAGFRLLLADTRGFAIVAAAFTLLLAASLFLVIAHRHPQTVADVPAEQPVAATPVTATIAQVPAPVHVVRARSNAHAEVESSEPPTDPDTLALAETLAPSHLAPALPLTAQERLMLRATRRGQPVEMAELETLRQPALQAAAEAHQRLRVRAYIEGLLGPLAAAQALNPTSPPPDDTPSTLSASPSSR